MPICDLTNPPLRPSRSREDVRANGPASNECTSHVPQRHNIPSQHEYLSKALPIKLPPPHINPILAHRASQILHRQHRSALPSASASTSKPSSRHSQHMRPTLSLILPLLLLLLRLLRRCRQTCCRTRGCRGRGRGWCRGARGGRAHARVLVSVGGNVGDELLGGEGEEAREGKRGDGGRESGKSEVVLSYSIWDLAAPSVSLGIHGSARSTETNQERRCGASLRLERSRPFWRESLEGKCPFGQERGVQEGVRPAGPRAAGRGQ